MSETLAHHCVPSELLMEYASGACPEAIGLAIATHLALCPWCRQTTEGFEALGGAMLDGTDAAAIPDGLLDATLGRLDTIAPEPPAPVIPAHPETAFLPEPLRGYVGERLAWRRVLPGIRRLDLRLRHRGEPVTLVRFAPGLVVPQHGHDGLELQVVLAGGYTSLDEHYGRGAFHLATPEVEHALHIDRGDPCVALIVREGRQRPRTVLGKLFAALTGA